MQELVKPEIHLRSGYRIERTAKRMKQVAQQALKKAEVDVTVDQWVILDQLEGEDAISQQQIGQRTFKDAPTVTRIIDLLCEKGYIRRKPDPDDRRKALIELTNSGKERIQSIRPIMLEVRREAYQGLKPEEIEHLIQLMDHIYTNLTD
ncbi:MAG: MarR family transcriptional regulator [Bacteroidetes bacterium]|nr:MarR family transcriptional regulator [Bacteroidota bacterium]